MIIGNVVVTPEPSVEDGNEERTYIDPYISLVSILAQVQCLPQHKLHLITLLRRE